MGLKCTAPVSMETLPSSARSLLSTSLPCLKQFSTGPKYVGSLSMRQAPVSSWKKAETRSSDSQPAEALLFATKKKWAGKCSTKYFGRAGIKIKHLTQKESLLRLKCFHKGQFKTTPSVVIRDAFRAVKKRASKRRPPLIHRCRRCGEPGSSSVQTQKAPHTVQKKCQKIAA